MAIGARLSVRSMGASQRRVSYLLAGARDPDLVERAPRFMVKPINDVMHGPFPTDGSEAST